MCNIIITPSSELILDQLERFHHMFFNRMWDFIQIGLLFRVLL